MAQDNIEPNNYRQPELITRGGMHERSVLEDAVVRNSWGKSRCELMCRFPNTGGLHRTSGGAPIETPTLCDPELITRGGMREGSVLEDAVERNSWGKSRCEQMCRFPNSGGLHHTCGDAPLETPLPAVELFLSSVCLFCGVTIEFPCAE